MKKTKVNVGAILLMAYAVIAYMLPQLIFNVFGNLLGNVGYYNIYMLATLINSVIGVSTASAFCTFVIIIACSIALLCGKRWGATAMGASMSVLSIVNILPLTMIIKEIFVEWIINMVAGYRGGLGLEILKIVIILLICIIIVSFVTIPAFISWILYSIAGSFANRADKKEKVSVFGIILKVLAAFGAVIPGFTQITLPIIAFIIIAFLGGMGTIGDGLLIILIGLFVLGFMLLLANLSLVLLFAGMILSVKCFPDKKKAKKDKCENDKEVYVEINEATELAAPVVSEPVIEEPVIEEAVAEEVAAEEPVVEEAVVEETVVEEVAAEEPVVEEPKDEEFDSDANVSID